MSKVSSPPDDPDSDHRSDELKRPTLSPRWADERYYSEGENIRSLYQQNEIRPGSDTIMPARSPWHMGQSFFRERNEPAIQDLKQAVNAADSFAVRHIIEKAPKKWENSDFFWIRELLDLGYTATQVGEMLVDKSYDSPWIYFHQNPIPGFRVQTQRHLPHCSHASLTDRPADEMAPSILDEHGSEPDNVPTGADLSDIKDTIERLCGIGGVAPFTRTPKEWSGQAAFNENSKEVSLTYQTNWKANSPAQTLHNLHKVTHKLCYAASILQNARLCCNSFTMLVLSGENVVQMVRIPFSWVLDLYQSLSVLKKSFPLPSEFQSSKGTPQALKTMMHHFKSYIRVGILSRRVLNRVVLTGLENGATSPDSKRAFGLCSLAVQTLSVGLLSYLAAHKAPLSPGFLEKDVHRIFLCGDNAPRSLPRIVAEPVKLTCLHDMLQGNVVAIRAVDAQTIPSRLNLSGSPEDILDTWGPGCYLTLPGRESHGELLGMRIKAGTIMASQKVDNLFHWFPTTYIPLSGRAFSKSESIAVGAPSEQFVTVNESCGKDEEDVFGNCEESLDQLDTFPSRWRTNQQQFAIQANVQGVGVQYILGRTKDLARPIKESILSKAGIEIPFLDESWGLQVSFCTGVARRVRLRELIADMIPAYKRTVETAEPWFEKEKSDIIEAFRDKNRNIDLLQWLLGKPKEQRQFLLELARAVIDLLQPTGIDSKTNTLIVAWTLSGRARCFKIKCKNEALWAALLEDSVECATFAYFTSNCLETDQINCSSTPILFSTFGTEVSFCDVSQRRLITSETPRRELQNDQVYPIGVPSLRLKARVQKSPLSNTTKLLLSRSIIPEDEYGSRYRMMQRLKMNPNPRLREKQEHRARAQPVLVIAKESAMIRLFSSHNTSGSLHTPQKTPAVQSTDSVMTELHGRNAVDSH